MADRPVEEDGFMLESDPTLSSSPLVLTTPESQEPATTASIQHDHTYSQTTPTDPSQSPGDEEMLSQELFSAEQMEVDVKTDHALDTADTLEHLPPGSAVGDTGTADTTQTLELGQVDSTGTADTTEVLEVGQMDSLPQDKATLSHIAPGSAVGVAKPASEVISPEVESESTSESISIEAPPSPSADQANETPPLLSADQASETSPLDKASETPPPPSANQAREGDPSLEELWELLPGYIAMVERSQCTTSEQLGKLMQQVLQLAAALNSKQITHTSSNLEH